MRQRQREKQSRQIQKKSSMMRPLPRKVFSQEEEPGYGVMICSCLRKRLFISPRSLDISQTMHSTHCNAGTREWDCSHIPRAWTALLGPGLRRILEHTGQGERSTHRSGFWALVAQTPAAPQGGAAPALLAAARQQPLFLGYFCSQFIPCLLELL